MSTIMKLREQCVLAERCKGILQSKAYAKELVRYPDLKEALGLAHPSQLGPILNLVMEDCKTLGEPLLPALVVNQSGMPGSGFFNKARGLGFYIEVNEDAEKAFWYWQIYHRMGLLKATFESQQPIKPVWETYGSILRQLGYDIEFEPLVKDPPNATSLKGKKLVKIKVIKIPTQEAKAQRLAFEKDPDAQTMINLMRSTLETEDSYWEAMLDPIVALRQALQSRTKEILGLNDDLTPKTLGHTEASGMPTGEDQPSASQLP